MGIEQVTAWAEAQKIAVSVDLVKAAKNQLKFLAAVDQNRYLFEEPALPWAIYRYNAFWLPLLAKHMENPVSEGPLVVPLDCEWIWHCHRLNPIRYKLDCEELFGKILDTHNVISFVQATSSKGATEEIWNKMYPEEPYQLDFKRPFPGDLLQGSSQRENFTSYDLISAVKRQIPFIFQVSRPHMSDNLFLQEAVARYRGFLHLIRVNRKRNLKRSCVPTYDVDLIWHSHQLHPVPYCKDLTELLGLVLQHDDTDSDRTKGKKLDTGFSATTRQWKETFGLGYWKAGAMYRGSFPTPVTRVPCPFRYEGNELNACENMIQYPVVKAVEVLLEVIDVKNLPERCRRNLLVSFSKKHPDKLFKTKNILSVSSESLEKQVASFQCEPNGEFLFELASGLPANKLMPESCELLGSCSLSLQELLASGSQLSVDKWLSVEPESGLKSSEPILLHVSISFTPPTTTPETFHLMSSQTFLKTSGFFPFIQSGEIKHSKIQTYVIDNEGKAVIGLQMREMTKDSTQCSPGFLKEVHCITNSGQEHTLAGFLGNYLFIKGTHSSFKLRSNSGDGDHLYQLVGNYKMVKLFPGRRLDFEPRPSGKQRAEQDFVTAVEFSAAHPYGRAVALFDFKSGTLKTMCDWIVQPGITLAYILSDIFGREGYTGIATESGNNKNMASEVIISPSIAKYDVRDECGGGSRCLAKSSECVSLCSGECEEGYGHGGLCDGRGGLCAGECVDLAESADNEHGGLCAGECVDLTEIENCSGGCGRGAPYVNISSTVKESLVA